MLETPAETNNGQVVMPKSMVPDTGWFNRNRMKFEDWWRGIRLFLKSNRVIETDNRIMVILACLREDVAGIYTQKKLNKLDNKLGTQDWENFMKKIKTTFSDKTKTAETRKCFKYNKEGHIAKDCKGI